MKISEQNIIDKYQSGEFRDCLSLSNDFLTIDPQNFNILSYKGACELKLGLYQDAVETFTKCLSINESGFHIWTFRGDAFYELEAYDRAFSDYWHSLQLEPDNGAVMDKCARSLYRLGNKQYALEYISKAVEKSESVEPFIIMMTMLRNIGNEEEAMKVQREAMLKFPHETNRIIGADI